MKRPPRPQPCQRRPVVRFLVSSCLAGVNCTWDGKNNLRPHIRMLVARKDAFPACPETLGGLPTPRPDSEIDSGDGGDVLDGRSRVITRSGRDVTESFIKGAYLALEAAARNGIRRAILKSNSPSCGAGKIYDGTFKKALKNGSGVLAVLLARHGIHVFTEKDYPKCPGRSIT